MHKSSSHRNQIRVNVLARELSFAIHSQAALKPIYNKCVNLVLGIDSNTINRDDSAYLYGAFEAFANTIIDIDGYDSWLPIESAPKDGTAILAWSEQNGIKHVHWLLNGWRLVEQDYSQMYHFTHWQPLPSRPKK